MKALRCTSHRERAKERARVCGGGTREKERVAPWTSGVFFCCFAKSMKRRREREGEKEWVGTKGKGRSPRNLCDKTRALMCQCVCACACV